MIDKFVVDATPAVVIDRSPRSSAVPTAIIATVAALVSIVLAGVACADEHPNQGGAKRFSLIKGRGVAVCDAYLKVLNRTNFKLTPFCGRPEDGPVPGFVHLQRRDLTAEQIQPLFNDVYEFMRFDDEFHVETFFHMPLELVAQDLRFNWIHVWTYSAPVDIANDGAPANVLIWQGYGAERDGAICGIPNDRDSDRPWYIDQRAFVLSPDGKTIDAQKTREIFGAAGEASATYRAKRPHGNSPFLPRGANPFRPLADTIGIFGYEGAYYIQTENKPTSKCAALPPVRVLLREHGRTRQMCAFRPESVPRVPSFDDHSEFGDCE